MRFTREQLRDKALYALEEAFEQCRYAPVPPSRSLRFALAYLANQASGREWFDAFWRSVTGAYDQEWGPQAADLLRISNARAGIVGIYRSLGLERPSGLL